MARTTFVAGDRTKLQWVLINSQNLGPLNLTGSTIKLRYRLSGGPIVERTMSIADAAGGTVEYVFASGELVAGTLRAEVVVTDASGKQFTSVVIFEVNVRAGL